ncbi:hypothetical protein [Aquimarina agarivorans]|uniref:hypothetical protein n=1 Tax=Aquimarina agarivorans TaxID=980584 RepID=UPI000248E927|nr:hypothetical protein [Aquimarina agarivorans]
MNITADLATIHKEFSENFHDLKAEILVLELLENTYLEEEDIVVLFKSNFARGFRRDILNSKINDKGKFEIQISRNGMYDAIPQGVFHKPVGINTQMAYKEIRRKNRKEEKDARMLFAPLENEFFLQKIAIEKEEKNNLFKFNNSIKDSFPIDFWGIRDKVPAKYIFEFVKALPFAHKISKDKDLIAKCLEKIIKEKVEIYNAFKPLNNSGNYHEEQVLGLNLSLDTKKTTVLFPFFTICITISNLNSRHLFTKNGIGTQFISVFCEYFVPLEAEYEIQVNNTSSKEIFCLNEESAVLGLSAKI